ncbi:MAG: Dabb family protein [Caldimonas sp.]
MFIHSALFWLRKELTPAQRDTFASEVRRLANIPYLESGFVGTPAQTERRAVADHSFDYATSLHFKSLEDHEFYQSKCEHHARFVASCASLWERVVIHDIEPMT